MNFAFLVEITLLKTSLTAVISAAGALTSPGKLIIFPPKVIWVQPVSYFGGCI